MRSYSSMSRMNKSEPCVFLNSATFVKPAAWNTCALNPYLACVTMPTSLSVIGHRFHGAILDQVTAVLCTAKIRTFQQ